MEGQPWVEKYRPKNFDDIVLDDINKTIFHNILKKKYFPNLLLYGPPGTGKTTTIISLAPDLWSLCVHLTCWDNIKSEMASGRPSSPVRLCSS